MSRWFRLGKGRIHEQMGFCEFCNSYEKLCSFDAVEFFQFFFLPTLPLGKKRIVRECSRCKNSRQVVDLRVWEERKRLAIEKAFQDWRMDPMDSHAAKKLMEAYIFYQDEEGFLRFAEAAKDDFPHDPEILASLGDGYDQFNHVSAAEEAYTRSWMLRDDLKTREKLGHVLLKQLRPDEAKPYLRHILEGRLRNRTFFLYLVVEAYQAVGRHKAALGYLKECCRFFPEMATSKTFRRLQGISEKLFDKNIRIPSANLPMSLDKTAIRRLEQRTFGCFNPKPEAVNFEKASGSKTGAEIQRIEKPILTPGGLQPVAKVVPAKSGRQEKPSVLAQSPPRPVVEGRKVQAAANVFPRGTGKGETPPVVTPSQPRAIVEERKAQPVAASPRMAEPRSKSMKFEFSLPESTRKFLPVKTAVAGFFAAILGLYLAMAVYKGYFQTVYLVNGLNYSYKVEINGIAHELPAMGHVAVKVAEGKVRVRPVGQGLGLQGQDCTIRTPFLLRPVHNRIFIINPDRVAVLFRDNSRYEEGYYNANNKPVSQYYAGRFLYQLDRVDYVFRNPAGGRPIPKNRTRLVQVPKPLTPRMAKRVFRSLPPEDARFFARYCIMFNPDDAIALAKYADLTTGEEVIEFIEPYLAKRPVKVELHRLYQDLMEKLDPDYNLAREYADYLAAEPDNKELLYLLGRVTPDFTYAETLYRRAATGEQPCAYGLHALAVNRLAEGEFEEALKLADQALRILPDQSRFLQTKKEALLGLGKVDELLTILKKEQAKDPYDAELVTEEVCAFMKKGQINSARASAQRFLMGMRRTNTNESKEWNHFFEAVLAHCMGDEESFVRNIEVLGDVNWQFQAAIVKGNLEEAGVLNEIMGSNPYNHLLLYIAAKINNRPEIATKHMQAAVNQLRRGDRQERLIAKCLQSNGSFDLNTLSRLTMDPSKKRIVLTALGIQFPWHQVFCFELAGKLNYKTTFPQRYLEKAMKKIGG